MAWNDLLANQIVSYTDVQGGGFTLNSGYTSTTSNRCMTKTNALEKYNLNATNLSAYSSNQLVPKGGLISNISGGLTIYVNIASSLSPIDATIWYFVTSAGSDGTQPYPLNKTWIQLGTQQTLPQCNSDILFGFIPMSPGQYAYIQIRNSTNTLLYQSQLGFKDIPSSNPCLVPQPGQYTGNFSYGIGSSGNINLLIKLTDPMTSISPPANPIICPDCTQGIISINTKNWQKCNLNVDTYRNGDPIPQATSNADWEDKDINGIGAWCYYNNDPANGPIYGKLYNAHAVNNITNGGLAPLGYHIPTRTEWTALSTFLGGDSTGGGKLKEPGACYWTSPNSLLTPYSGFAALPGGYRHPTGDPFFGINTSGYFWSSTVFDPGSQYSRYMFNGSTVLVEQSLSKGFGFSVRLIQD